MPEFAGTVRIERYRDGTARLLVDGVEFPYVIQPQVTVEFEDVPTVVLRMYADTVQMVEGPGGES